MKPLEKPCHVCGDEKKKTMKGSFGKIPVVMVVCLKCTNLTFFLTVADTDTRREIPIDQMSPEVKDELGL